MRTLAAFTTAACVGMVSASLPLLSISVSDGSWPVPSSEGLYLGDIRAVLNVSSNDITDGLVSAQIFWRRRDNNPEVKALVATTASGSPVKVTGSTIGSICGAITLDVGQTGPGLYYVYYLPYVQTGGGAWLHFHWFNCTDQNNHACVLGHASVPTRPSAPRLVQEPPAAATLHWAQLSSADACDTVTPAASLVLGLETRNAFHGFQSNELIAAPGEVAAVSTGYGHRMRHDEQGSGTVDGLQAISHQSTAVPFLVFAEDAQHPVRNFDWLSARWALWPGPPAPAPNEYLGQGIAPGAFHVFQIGLYAQAGDVTSLTASFTDLAGPDGSGLSIPSTAIRVFNLGGLGVDNQPFTKVYNLSNGAVGSLYVGVDIPADASLQGNFTGTATLSCASCGGSTVTVYITLELAGAPVTDHGQSDIYSLARMAWLDSATGWEDTVPQPYVPVSVVASSPLAVGCMDKELQLGQDGLPTAILINTTKVRKGQPTVLTRSMLAPGTGLTFTPYDSAGQPLSTTVTQDASITNITNSSVAWTAESTATSPASPGASLTITTVGKLDFDSYSEFSVTLAVPSSATGPMGLTDVQLSYTVNPALLQYIVGMGLEGSAWPGTPASESARRAGEAAGALGHAAVGAQPAWAWRWSNSTCTNKLWTGRIDAGVLLNLKGDGDLWNSPMFGVDYPVIPFVPPSWGGVGQAPIGNAYGVNVTAGGTVVAYSGPRVLQPGDRVTFLFDLLLTPARPLDMASHWTQRTVQVGYGDAPYGNYMTPQAVAAQGATIVTLHQGIPGMINGSLVNPYINYPFTPDVVPLLTNYTAQSNALGMRTKFYYTIRELSNHAAELFPLLALQGEVILNEGSPYVIPQPGYCQDWDCHGGEVFLHQHIQNYYTECWQQNLADGEWDAAVCDRGTSRWLSYYIQGLQHSVGYAPFINGIYYDGINFDRMSMRRVRRAADAAMQARVEQLQAKVASHGPQALDEHETALLNLPTAQRRPHLDLHTGHDATPPVTAYASHYGYMDAVWNGEGFDFSKGPEYWLVEVSEHLHGLTGDRLGGAVPSDDFKGMLWGMVQRNAGSAPALWALWDQAGLNTTTQIGWWEDDAVVTLQGNCSSPSPPYHTRLLATTYTAYGSHALIAVASFCPTDTTVTLNFDWAGLGLSPTSVAAVAPAVPEVQTGGPVSSPTGPFTIKSGDGLLLILTAA